MAEDKYLSTGQVARMCSVTRDTVLKWVQSGALPARKTAGGHNRIAQSDVEKLIGFRSLSHEKQMRGADVSYCWEHHFHNGVPAACAKCVVYRLRALRCYEAAQMFYEHGFSGLFCESTCAECDYFKEVREQGTNVLAITDNPDLEALFLKDAGSISFNLRIAHCGYNCSSVLNHFRPDIVLIDCSIGQGQTTDIIHHLRHDPRVPFVRIVAVSSSGKFPPECESGLVGHLQGPLSIDAIQKVALPFRSRGELAESQVME